ncbi:sodium:solute symporter [Chryseobacterium sp. Marseille-Q3244]|uniref:sodium:solute symporter family transporter n=1 Tax=Chryseobacterium sp. Marseille-Q3244 TaxID=2758092 RepID=UPI002025AB9B|nr:sodium:solute symporter [Chryseobacterium sp. Marseille-Q3244]
MNVDNNWTVLIGIVLAMYAVAIIFFVIRGARKANNMKDYAVGNMSFSPWMVGLSLAASMTSAASFIINPGFIALYGVSGFISLGIILPLSAFISLTVMAKSFANVGVQFNAKTMAEWMGNRFKSQAYRFFFAFLGLLLISFIVLINVGITNVISKALHIDPFYVLLIITVFVFGYMMFGGANSLMYTNSMQVIFKLLVALIMLGSGFYLFKDGIGSFLGKLHDIDPNLTTLTNKESPLFRDFFEIVVCQIIVGVAIICQPHIITKTLMLKSPAHVNKFLLSAIVFMTLFFLVVGVGFYARIIYPDLTINEQKMKMDEIIPNYVVARFSVLVGLIVVVGLVSAGQATLESLIQSISSSITLDILEPIFKEKVARHNLLVNKFVIIILAVVSFLISYQQIINPTLSVGIFAQMGVYGYFAAAFVPIIFGTFVKGVKLSTVFIASVTAFVVHFGIYFLAITTYMKGPIKNPGVSAAIAILISLLIAIILHIFNRNKIES